MPLDRSDELALELERDIPEEPLQQGAHVVPAQQQFPEHPGEGLAQLVLLELPGDGIGALCDEHLMEELRVVDQPLLKQADLLLKQLDGFAVLQGPDLFPRVLDAVAAGFDFQARPVVVLYIGLIIGTVWSRTGRGTESPGKLVGRL